MIVVAGAGLTGLSAAIATREVGANVVLLEKGRDDVGGNAAFPGDCSCSATTGRTT